MRKLLAVLVVLLVGMIYVSCSKDDDKSEPKSINLQEAIVGTWSITYNTYYSTKTDIVTFTDSKTFQAKCSLNTYKGEYTVIDNIINLYEPTDKYPLDVIVIKSIDKASFVGKSEDYMGEIKGTRIY